MIKLKTLSFLLILTLFSCFKKEGKEIETNILSKTQIDQIERGYGMFIHFGVNTFNETEWSNGKLPASSYKPTDLDCDQWIKIAKDAGFRYVILVTKHHDGFSLWDSKYTDYDVASSPVKTDVVAEVAKACKKYGIKLGLYYSLWDRHEPSYKNTEAYNGYMKNQLTELMTNYGDICELWFDGGWDKKDDEWNLPEIYKYVKEMQPNCLITVNHTIGKPENHSAIRQPKNYTKGDPIRYFPVDFRIKDPNLARWNDPKYYNRDGKEHYLAFEHTICISDRWNWFQKKNVLAARPLDELEELFYWGTSNDNIMIVNVPPDLTGKIRTNEKLRILELADRLNIRGGTNKLPKGPENLIFNKKIIASSQVDKHNAEKAIDFSLETYWTANDSIANLEIDFEKEITFDRISLFEKAKMRSLGDGFSSIRDFNVQEYELQTYSNGKWDTFYKGEIIGACKIINLPVEITAEKIRLNILKSKENPSISHISIANNKTKGFRSVSL
ncbi:alpha-L-fucosidase [Polaribacter haliotis]|uniref:alpha-L-fucosidase n=1 Tax=Polaribacter haliotis TaxID=1888915 RepID=A0A7L8AFZ8_9FLAO|nr:alpha-L-fucosidase [Polaribacter haliotis]QOD60739.1 alpha-L-fucosidase [Polaribacter haliotis]